MACCLSWALPSLQRFLISLTETKEETQSESLFETTAPGTVGHPSRRGTVYCASGRDRHDPKSCPEVKGEGEGVKSAECGLCTQSARFPLGGGPEEALAKLHPLLTTL